MPCYHPLQGFYSKAVNPSGKRGLVFDIARSNGKSVQVPCGQCIGCRLERSRQWALRCVHESQMWERNCFITLTYDNDHLPSDGSLHKRDWQLFMKKFRKKFGSNIRFFMCGEYGEQLSRPHYHACIFNFDFDDKYLWSTRDNVRLYRSDSLDQLWSKGYCTVGDVTFESAAYVARYIVKKINGDLAADHYASVDTCTGEYSYKHPEFTLMSRRPGIGATWHSRYKSDLDKDYITSRGVKMRPPKFYDRLLEKENPDELLLRKQTRLVNALKHAEDNTQSRLNVKEQVKNHRIKLLKRGFENEI